MLNAARIHTQRATQPAARTSGIAPHRSSPNWTNSAISPSSGKLTPASMIHQPTALLGCLSTRRRPNVPTATKAKSSNAWMSAPAWSAGSVVGRPLVANNRTTSTT